MIIIQPLNYEWIIPQIESLKLNKADKNKIYDKIAYEYVQYTKDLIKKQYYGWKPLSKPYRKWKKKMGLNTGKWIATGKLHKRLKYTKSNRTIGFSTSRYSNGIYINQVARLLEYGSPLKGLPPRPLFRTSLAYFNRHIKKITKEILSEYTV